MGAFRCLALPRTSQLGLVFLGSVGLMSESPKVPANGNVRRDVQRGDQHLRDGWALA